MNVFENSGPINFSKPDFFLRYVFSRDPLEFLAISVITHANTER